MAARIAEMAVSDALEAQDGWDCSARRRFGVGTRDAADLGWFPFLAVIKDAGAENASGWRQAI